MERCKYSRQGAGQTSRHPSSDACGPALGRLLAPAPPTGRTPFGMSPAYGGSDDEGTEWNYTVGGASDLEGGTPPGSIFNYSVRGGSTAALTAPLMAGQSGRLSRQASARDMAVSGGRAGLLRGLLPPTTDRLPDRQGVARGGRPPRPGSIAGVSPTGGALGRSPSGLVAAPISSSAGPAAATALPPGNSPKGWDASRLGATIQNLGAGHS